ncbi:hypothetical protein FZEAL_10728 [Fusarium zealandicum]|uniref:Uncharacterized protein n=1 Tax=Fusarium zealandicum TaxID=1053134 RepID=A0A8H4TX74_9HYPO|nr:hypothetical protein FZEAL_10728 [Fusarium zealandicum]
MLPLSSLGLEANSPRGGSRGELIICKRRASLSATWIRELTSPHAWEQLLRSRTTHDVRGWDVSRCSTGASRGPFPDLDFYVGDPLIPTIVQLRSWLMGMITTADLDLDPRDELSASQTPDDQTGWTWLILQGPADMCRDRDVRGAAIIPVNIIARGFSIV